MKLQPGLGGFYEIQPRNGLGLFYNSWGPYGPMLLKIAFNKQVIKPRQAEAVE